MKTHSVLFFGLALFSAHAAAQADVSEPTHVKDVSLHSSSCADESAFTVDKDGRITVDLRASSQARDVFCNTVLRITVPRGFSIAEGQDAELIVSGDLQQSGDKLLMVFKAQSADLVDKVLKGTTLNLEKPQNSHVSLSGSANLPVIGSCEKDREAFLAFATAARVAKGNSESPPVAKLEKLSLPAIKLSPMDCKNEPERS